MATIDKRNVIISFKVDSANAEKGIDKVDKQVTGLSKTLQNAASTFGGLFAFDLFGRLSDGLSSVASNALDLAINAEQTEIAFKTFLGSAEAAKQVIDELNEFSEITPFTPESVIKAGQSLLAFGFEADQVVKTLERIGDVASASGKDFNELTLIYGKARISGKVFTEDLNQLSEAGIDLNNELAEALGAPVDSIRKLASEGKIGFDALEQAFISATSEGGKFFGLTAAQSESLGGKISTLQGKFDAFTRELAERLVPALKSVVDTLINFFSNISVDTVIKFAKGIGTVVAAIVSYNTAIKIAAVTTSLLKTAQIAAAGATALFTGNVGRARAAMRALNLTIRANPIGLLTSALTLAIGAFFTFKDAANDAADAQENVNEAVAKGNEILGNTASLEQRSKVIDRLGKAEVERIKQQAEENIRAIQERNTALISEEERLRDNIADIEQQISDERQKFSAATSNADRKAASDRINNLTQTLNILKSQIQQEAGLTAEQIEGTRESNQQIVQLAEKRLKDLSKVTKRESEEQIKLRQDFNKELRQLQEEINDDYLALVVTGYKSVLDADEQALQDRLDEGKRRRKLFEGETEDEFKAQLEATNKRNQERLDGLVRDADKIRNELLSQDGLTADRRAEIEEEYSERINQINIDRLKSQLSLLEIGSNEFLNLEQEIRNKEEEAAREEIEEEQKKAEEKLKIREELAKKTIAIGKTILEAQQQRLDEDLELQRDRLENALILIENGGAEQVELEERRLEQIQQARERNAQRLRIVSAIEVAANNAVAISEGVVAVAKAFSDGNVLTGIATSISLASTIATVISAFNGAFADVPAFATGTEFFDGVGTATSDSNLARLSRGERVVPTDKNMKYFDTLNEFQKGTVKADFLHKIAQGEIDLPTVRGERIVQDSSSDNKRLEGLMEGMIKRLDKLEMNVTLDKNGFVASLQKHIAKQGKMKNKLHG